MSFRATFLPLLLSLTPSAFTFAAGEQPPAVPQSSAASGGFLVSPIRDNSVSLHDFGGTPIKEWQTGYPPAGAPRLLSSGGLLHVGRMDSVFKIDPHFHDARGRGGIVQEFGADGSRRWRYRMATQEYFVHDDALQLSNGNFLLLVWKWQSSDEWLAAGRLPDLLGLDGMWIDEIWEVTPGTTESGTIVWRWSSWDYRVQDTTREVDAFGDCKSNWRSINLSHPPRPHKAWADLRRIECCMEEGLIIVWSHSFNEVWIIEHRGPGQGTTGRSPSGGSTACRPGLVYRAGNPTLFARKASNEDLYLGFRDMAIMKEADQWVLGILHGYEIRGEGRRQGLEKVNLSNLRAHVADGQDQPPVLARGESGDLQRLKLKADQQIRGISVAGQDWVLTSQTMGQVFLAPEGKPAQVVFEQRQDDPAKASARGLQRGRHYLITKAAGAKW